jgi:hypothetical protein
MTDSVDSEKIKKRIEEFHGRLKETEDDAEDFDEEYTEIPNMSPAAYADFMTRRAATPFGQLFFVEFHDFVVHELLPTYLQGDEKLREELLELVDRCFYVQSRMWSLMKEYRWKLQHASQEERPTVLRRLLLFAVLEEESMDHYETGTILRSAWYGMKHEGTDPEPFFKEAAGIAGKRKVIFGRSAQEVLEWYVGELKS